MSGELPAALRAAIDALAAGHSGRVLAEASARLSADYRAGKGTRFTEAVDFAAYAAVRLPATYAAARAAIAEAADRIDYSPKSLIDLGCGPGSAAWAATDIFDTLDTVEMIDSSAGMMETGRRLAAAGPRPLSDALWSRFSIADALASDRRAHCVVSSYAFNELPPDSLAAQAGALCRMATGLVIIVEPGTRQGFATIHALRSGFIAAGWHIVAPCPSDHPCPVEPPDWCHFAERLPRLRLHRLAKGADAPFEDEPYSYVAAVASGIPIRPAAARILRPPRATKPGTDFRLCTPQGLADRHVPARDRDLAKRTRKCGWGDAFPGEAMEG